MNRQIMKKLLKIYSKLPMNRKEDVSELQLW